METNKKDSPNSTAAPLAYPSKSKSKPAKSPKEYPSIYSPLVISKSSNRTIECHAFDFREFLNMSKNANLITDEQTAKLIEAFEDGVLTQATDFLALAKAVREFGFSLNNFYEQKVGQIPKYIVFKGRRNFRRFITGTRYKVDNAKMIALRIGKAGQNRSLKLSGILSVALYTAGNLNLICEGAVAEFSIGLGINAIEGAATGLIAAKLATVAFAGSVALPIVGGIIIAGILFAGLDWLDRKYDYRKKITQLIISVFNDGYKEWLKTIKDTIKETRETIGKAKRIDERQFAHWLITQFRYAAP